jgi:hypothetical protein
MIEAYGPDRTTSSGTTIGPVVENLCMTRAFLVHDLTAKDFFRGARDCKGAPSLAMWTTLRASLRLNP